MAQRVTRGMARWTRKFSVSEVEAKLNRRGITANGLKRIEAAEKGPSVRIVKVRIMKNKNPVVSVKYEPYLSGVRKQEKRTSAR